MDDDDVVYDMQLSGYPDDDEDEDDDDDETDEDDANDDDDPGTSNPSHGTYVGLAAGAAAATPHVTNGQAPALTANRASVPVANGHQAVGRIAKECNKHCNRRDCKHHERYVD